MSLRSLALPRGSLASLFRFTHVFCSLTRVLTRSTCLCYSFFHVASHLLVSGSMSVYPSHFHSTRNSLASLLLTHSCHFNLFTTFLSLTSVPFLVTNCLSLITLLSRVPLSLTHSSLANDLTRFSLPPCLLSTHFTCLFYTQSTCFPFTH